MPDQTREQQIAERQAIVDELVTLVADKDHAATMDALITVYRDLAKKFACCTQAAADQAMTIAMELAFHAALARPAAPSGEQLASSPPIPPRLH